MSSDSIEPKKVFIESAARDADSSMSCSESSRTALRAPTNITTRIVTDTDRTNSSTLLRRLVRILTVRMSPANP